MEEDDSMVNHLTKLQDLREQLLNIDEVTPANTVNLTLDSQPESYLGFHTSLNVLEGGCQSSYLSRVGRTIVARRPIKEKCVYSWW